MRSIKSLERGLEILETIAVAPRGIRVKDIAEQIKDPISNITLFLNSLILSGFVNKDETTGKYFISQKISDIAENINKAQNSLLKNCALEVMEELRDEFNENVLISVMRGHDVNFIYKLQSRRSIQIHENSDVYYPPHVTAAGKAILAFLPEDLREHYLEDGLYHRFTEKSLVNPKMLREELKNVKQNGFAINRGEFENEIMAVAAPVMMEAKVIGSLVVQFPNFRYSESSLSEFGIRIVESAKIIEENICSTIADYST
ncbi:MAG: IclR family transcriptional regulator [Spirochaetales bacterium]|uniref:IclR family transcriptional regulator n=1 Tax=Candidatus Thalassospirochaeta sargassi TaxID=3119039 RepID=A0AAJ1IJX9_9SPIO|nr:IclR family transcriptional regulator [Spirochaetales bacterium]